MFDKELVIPIRFDLSCFELIVKWNGELEYVFTNDDGVIHFDTDEFTEICRAFDSVEFNKFVEAHNECVKAYEKYGYSYAELFVAYGCDETTFSSAVDAFETAIEKRITANERRQNAHAAWSLATSVSLGECEFLNFYTLCEIGSRMLHVEYDALAY